MSKQKDEGIVVIGIDPGMETTGFGIIQENSGKADCIAQGCIRGGKRKSHVFRLANIYDKIIDIIDRYRPSEAAIESIFFHPKTLRSALVMSEVRGVVILACAHKDITVHEYSPREIKQSVVGIGSADKEQVKYMVSRLLQIKDRELDLNVSDALAVALCHIHRRNLVLKEAR